MRLFLRGFHKDRSRGLFFWPSGAVIKGTAAECRIHELTTDKTISKSLNKLKEPHRELFYFLAIRHYSTNRLAEMEGVSDRNIRKVRATVMKKLRIPLYEHLKKSKTLTAREREFLKRYEEADNEKSF